MTVEDLRHALESMGLDATDVGQQQPLKALFRRALAKAQGLPSPTRSGADLHPKQMEG